MGKDERRDPDASDVPELNSDAEMETEAEAEAVMNGEDLASNASTEREGVGAVSAEASDETERKEPPSPDPADRMDLARLETRVRQLEEENRNLKDSLLRKMAEFENLKKRTAREKDEAVRYGTAGILSSLLEVLDNFDRALATEPTIEDHHSFYEGMKLVAKHLFDILKSEGLVEINPKEEPFDPFFHEAMMRKESTEFPENTVLEVFQKGYKLRDRLLRPARVMVSTRPTDAASEETEPEETVPPMEEPEGAGESGARESEPGDERKVSNGMGEGEESPTEQDGSIEGEDEA